MSQVNHDSRHIWLLLLARGGWWAPREVDVELGFASGHAQRRLQKLRKHSSTLAHRLVQAKPPRGEYAVMPGCTVPEGITVAEIAQALAPAETRAASPVLPLDTSTWLSPSELEFGTARGLIDGGSA